MIHYLAIPYILLALLALGLYHLQGQKDLFLANNLLIAIMATMLLVLEVGALVIDFCGGYFPEFVTFNYRAYGIGFYVKIVLTFLALFLPLLNYLQKCRENVNLQYIILLPYIGLAIFGFVYRDAINLLPGWHTIILPPCYSFVAYCPLFIFGIIANYLIIKLK